MTNPVVRVLSIETSCDECSAAVVERSPGVSSTVRVLSNSVFSQIEIHRKYGGVVPEVASRNHLETLPEVVEDALKSASVNFSDLSAIAVTNRPGLIGTLLVGVSYAKALAWSLDKPLIPVHHLQGHLHSLFIEEQKELSGLVALANLPLLVCLVSGGHTNLYLVRKFPPLALDAQLLGSSRDDAAGEAFDKTAKLLGLPYPGGVVLDQWASKGNPKKYAFPRPLKDGSLDFSFSGLKTAVAVQLAKEGYEPFHWGIPDATKLPQAQVLFDYCASIQRAIVDTLIYKIALALDQTQARGLAVVGGVSANSELRARLSQEVRVPVFFPDKKYCTDNAAMIGASAAFQFERGEFLEKEALLKLNAYSG